jgi:hypothetical protein
MVARSNEDVKDIISHHFEIRKSEFYVTRRCPDSFLAYFHDTHDKNVVFVAASVVVVGLGLHAWDIDWLGNKELIPYHVKLSLKGIPSHAWFQEIAQLILGMKLSFDMLMKKLRGHLITEPFSAGWFAETLPESLK